MVNLTHFTLRNGQKIPLTGFGLYLVPIDEAQRATYDALKAGYRLVDTATVYLNEAETGKGVVQFLKEHPEVKRSDIIYGSKLWEKDYDYPDAVKAIQTSLNKVKDLGYMDYYLIHSSGTGKKQRLEAYKAIQEAVQRGEVKHIGVSNWGLKHLQELYEWPGLEVEPSINQIELNPWLLHQDIVDFCNEKNIIVEAYSPLTQGLRINDPKITALAQKYKKSNAQILLRWAIDRKTLPIAKSVKPDRVRENLDILEWDLTDKDVEELGDPNSYFICSSTWDPTVRP